MHSSVAASNPPMADQRTYNFALEVDPASTSAYISSIAVLYILAVCGRLSLSLHETVSKYTSVIKKKN